LETEYRLALVYRDAGSYGEAEPLLNHLVGPRRRVLGPEHPDSLNALQELAILYRATARYDKAETLLTRLVAVRRRVSGEEHPDTLEATSHP
jgi:tetratricopeptide (TPR) repeat protein